MTWRDGVEVITKAKVAGEGRSWSAGTILNVVMVAAGVGCGIGALVVKDEEAKKSLLAGAACLYAGQLLENLCSNTLGLLTNQMSQNEAIHCL